jgi:hypothetical protein
MIFVCTLYKTIVLLLVITSTRRLLIRSVGTPASAEEDISDKYSNPNILSYSTLDSMPFERNTLEKTHFVLSKYASMSTTAWQPPRAAENESQRPHQAPTN